MAEKYENMVGGKLYIINAWVDERENLVQVVYEDNKTGELYVAKREAGDKAVLVVSLDGSLRYISYKEFQGMVGGLGD